MKLIEIDIPLIHGYRAIVNFKGSLTALILQNLSDGPNHGYRIAQDIKQKSKGVLDFKEGALYPALHGLEGKGFIESFSRVENGRTRCYYRLTRKGRGSLAKQKEEWIRFSDAVNLVFQET